MRKQELLAKIQEICPDAFIHQGEDDDGEIVIMTGLLELEDGAELVSIEETNHLHRNTVDEDKSIFYFAEDGNFGDADGLIILNTSKWNENDWTDIEETPDSSRPAVAEVISRKYSK